MANEEMTAGKTAQRSLKMGGRSRVVNQFDTILMRGRNLYAKSWHDRGIEVKRRSLVKAIEEGDSFVYTKDVFLKEFARRVSILLDSQLFNKKCQEAQLVPFNAATHIVMMDGKKGIESLVIDRLYEGENSKFQPFPEWNYPIFDQSELAPYLDPISEGDHSID